MESEREAAREAVSAAEVGSEPEPELLRARARRRGEEGGLGEVVL